jgi:anti-sigma regulatory factor (Ser/Thr protein kinase)
MTADDTPETLIRAVKEQACRYLRKPVEPQTLAEVVREVLESKPPSRPIEVLSSRPNWVELLVPCEFQSANKIHSLLTSLDADLPEEVRESVALAFRELLMNAVEWGGKLDPSRSVRIAYLRARRMVLYRISDPGQGFSFGDLAHSALANATEQSFEHIEVRQRKGLRPGGFGLLMTRALVDELIYNEAQNEVVFVKYLD